METSNRSLISIGLNLRIYIFSSKFIRCNLVKFNHSNVSITSDYDLISSVLVQIESNKYFINCDA